MASQGKNNSKKYMFKEGSNPLFPISNKNPSSLNYYSAVNINVKSESNRHNKKQLSNEIITNLQNKKIIDKSSVIKNYKEINKTYSTSRPKEEKQLLKLNNSKLSKIKPLDFSSNININNSQVLDKYSHKKSLLSANKAYNKTNINLEIDSSRYFKNNLNIISPKNLGNSQIFNNNNNNIYNLRKPNINKNIIQLTNSNNNSYYNNIIINDNSSTNINTNLNLNKQKKSVNNYYLQTEKNKNYAKSPKESNVKLIFTNPKIFDKKLDVHDGPIILKKKESSSLPLTYTTPGGQKTNSSLDKNILNGEYKLHLKKPKKNNSNDNNIINMNVNNFINIKKDEQFNNIKKNKIRGPEDLHFYYILVIQDGKKNEKEFEKD